MRLRLMLLFSVLLLCSVCAYGQDPIPKPNPRKNATTTTTTSSSSSSSSKKTSSTTAKKTGSLSVQYTPSGATVYVDGSKKGTTPCELSGLSEGSHTVKISMSGYVTATRTVSISGGVVREIAGSLSRESTAVTTSSSSSTSTGSGTHAGHAYVDMGLSVKWATCNVGASSPGDYGNYYAWGETETKSNYTSDNCATYNKQISDIGGTSRDVARVKWGGNWRMPTEAEFEELLDQDNCTWEWTTQNGHNGYKVKSKKTGNSIFLPAAGWRYGTSLYLAGERGSYWGSTPGESDPQIAVYLYFYSSYRRGTYWYYRHLGFTVRPVVEF